VTVIEPFRGPLIRTGSGHVLLGGSALADVVRALKAAQHVTRGDGFGPNPRWLWLLEQLEAELAASGNASSPGIEELPPIAARSLSDEQPITTREAAELLGCTARNVRGLSSRGVLESGRVVAGRMIFDRTEVVAEVLRRAECQRRDRP
jgi:hypothetical protein